MSLLKLFFLKVVFNLFLFSQTFSVNTFYLFLYPHCLHQLVFIKFFREVSSGFFYKTAEEKENLVKAERKFIEDRVQKIIDLKDKVCALSNKGFVVINQKVSKKVYILTICKCSLVFLKVWFVNLQESLRSFW